MAFNPNLKDFTPNIDTLTITDKWLIERTNQFAKLAKGYYDEVKTCEVISEFEKFVDDLSKKYNVELFMIIKRIKDVRKINQFKQKFDVLAIPCDRAYFVVPDKSEELINSKNSPEVRQQIEEVAETFRTNNLVKEKSVLKKTRKPNK